jgi:hypothetical protein
VCFAAADAQLLHKALERLMRIALAASDNRVVGQVLTLWLQLNADAVSTVLRGLPAWGIVAVNLSVVVVGVVTMYLQLRKDERLDKLRQRIRGINIRRRVEVMRQRSIANLDRMASFRPGRASVMQRESSLGEVEGLDRRAFSLRNLGRLPSIKGAWWAEEEEDQDEDDDDIDDGSPLPPVRRISGASRRATSFRDSAEADDTEGAVRARPLDAAFSRAEGFKRRVYKVDWGRCSISLSSKARLVAPRIADLCNLGSFPIVGQTLASSVVFFCRATSDCWPYTCVFS